MNGNRIKELKGLEELTNLRVLDLSSNEIVELGGLENLTNLDDLRLEGNPIYHTLQQKVLNFSQMSIEERTVVIRTIEKREALAKKKPLEEESPKRNGELS